MIDHLYLLLNRVRVSGFRELTQCPTVTYMGKALFALHEMFRGDFYEMNRREFSRVCLCLILITR